MLGLLSSVVAPDIPPVQDFKHHWDSFLHYYATKQHSELKSEPIEATKLTFHLNKMLKLLMEEQSSAPSPYQLTPSMEFLLHHNVLDILVTLCQSDSPPGIRPYIFNLFIFLLDKTRYAILPETSCHQPLRRLVLVCTLTKASPTESQEIKFISMLCGKIKRKPDLIHIFLDSSVKDISVTPNSFNTSRQSSGRVSRDSQAVNLVNIEKLAINVKDALASLHNKHLLAAALLNYIDSADYILSCSAMEALLLISGLESDLAAQALVTGTSFMSTLLTRLITFYTSIPGAVDPARLEEILVNWVQVHHYHSEDMQDPSFQGRTELLAFFSFLDFLDHLIRVSHSFTAQSLASEIKEQFFERHLEPKLLSEGADSEESELILGLAFTSQTWLHIKSDRLAHSFSVWLLGEQLSDQPTLPTHMLKDKLITLCTMPGLVGLEAVRMFDVLLSSPCPYILDRLVTVHMESRGYHMSNSNPEAIINSWSDVEDEREKIENLSEEIKRPSRSVTPSRTLAPSNIHRLVNCWLYLVPDQLRLDEVRGSGYDQYVADASKQVETVAKDCSSFDWPREATGGWEKSETSSSDSRIEADPSRQWSEGRFLSTILDKLSMCLDSDYDSNLQLTSIISKLAQLPHPHLHEYLLNPTIPLAPGVRSLYTVLKEVLGKAIVKSDTISHFPLKMLGCRRRMLGDQKSASKEIECQPEEQVLLEAILVLDEFCKELAAVTFVKYHCFA